jgi:hypothetical protein
LAAEFGNFPSDLSFPAVDEKRRRGHQARTDDVADRLNEFGSGRPDGSKRRPRRPQGNSREVILRRLRAHHPELHALVLSGEISPFAAAVAAKFRKRPGRQPKRPVAPLELELSADEQLELWLGPDERRGSLFSTAQELREAWARHKDRLMEWWGSNCRRPAAWWEFEAPDGLEFPGLDHESRVLYEHNLLSPQERIEFEMQRQSQKKSPVAIAEGPQSA